MFDMWCMLGARVPTYVSFRLKPARSPANRHRPEQEGAVHDPLDPTQLSGGSRLRPRGLHLGAAGAGRAPATGSTPTWTQRSRSSTRTCPARPSSGRGSEGILVIPNIRKVGFFASGAYGEGALLIGPAKVDYYSMSAAGFGLTFGAAEFNQALFFIDRPGAAGLPRRRRLGARRRRRLRREAGRRRRRPDLDPDQPADHRGGLRSARADRRREPRRRQVQPHHPLTADSAAPSPPGGAGSGTSRVRADRAGARQRRIERHRDVLGPPPERGEVVVVAREHVAALAGRDDEDARTPGRRSRRPPGSRRRARSGRARGRSRPSARARACGRRRASTGGCSRAGGAAAPRRGSVCRCSAWCASPQRQLSSRGP